MSTLMVEAQDHAVSSVISEYNESNVVMSPDGTTLYFTLSNHVLNRGGKNDKGDIWYSKRDINNVWSVPTRLAGPVNNHLNNRVVGFSADGTTMYLHGLYKKGKRSATLQGISASKWNGRIWSQPTDITIPYFKNNSKDQSGYVTPDEEVMLLSLESFKTQGNEDIYVSLKQSDGKWSELINLGSVINTRYQEFTPYITDDKKLLFFSSNGREGAGSSDVYFSRRLNDSWQSWSEPESIGEWINGEGRDLNFFLSDHMRKVVWVSLKNSDEYGEIRISEPTPSMDTLFSEVIAREETVLVEQNSSAPIYGTVSDQVGLPLSNVPVDIRHKGEEWTIVTDAVGEYFWNEEGVSGDVEVHVSSPTYIPQTLNVKIQAEEHREVNVQLIPAEVGVTVNLKNVLFQRGTAKFLPGSTAALNDVLELMKVNPSIKIELSGHTDNTGVERKNIKLSKQRVKTVRNYLISQGVTKSRISGDGYGGSKPIASNKSERTRQLNRRVEFTIVDN